MTCWTERTLYVDDWFVISVVFWFEIIYLCKYVKTYVQRQHRRSQERVA